MQLPLSGDGFILRAHTMNDLSDFHALFSDPDVVRYLYEEPLARDQAAEHLSRRLGDALPTTEGEWLNLAVQVDGHCVGSVGVKLVSSEHRQCEIGYIIAPSVQGQGLATKASRVMLSVAFEDLDAHRVCGRLDARNSRSAQVLERLGMRREAHLIENEWVKGEWTDEVVYAITEDEWREEAGEPRA